MKATGSSEGIAGVAPEPLFERRVTRPPPGSLVACGSGRKAARAQSARRHRGPEAGGVDDAEPAARCLSSRGGSKRPRPRPQSATERLDSIETFMYNDSDAGDFVSDEMRAGMRSLLEFTSAYELRCLCQALNVKTKGARQKGERKVKRTKFELVDAIVAQRLTGPKTAQRDFWLALQPMWESTLVDYLRTWQDPGAERKRVDPRVSMMIRWRRTKLAPPPRHLPSFVPRTAFVGPVHSLEVEQAAATARVRGEELAKQKAVAEAEQREAEANAAAEAAEARRKAVEAERGQSAVLRALASSGNLPPPPKPKPKPKPKSKREMLASRRPPPRPQTPPPRCRDPRVLMLLNALKAEEAAFKRQEATVRASGDPDEMIKFFEHVGQMRSVERQGQRYLIKRIADSTALAEHAEAGAAAARRRLAALAGVGDGASASGVSGSGSGSGKGDAAGRHHAQLGLWLAVAGRSLAARQQLASYVVPTRTQMLDDLQRLQSQCQRAQVALNRSVDRASGTEWKKAKLKRELEALREAHSTKNAKFEELCERAVAYGASDEASLDALGVVQADARQRRDALASRVRRCATPLLRMLRFAGGSVPGPRERAAAEKGREQAATLLQGLGLMAGDALAEQQERTGMWREELSQRRAAALAEARGSRGRKGGRSKKGGNSSTNRKKRKKKKKKLPRRARLDRLRKKAVAKRKRAERKAQAKLAKQAKLQAAKQAKQAELQAAPSPGGKENEQAAPVSITDAGNI